MIERFDVREARANFCHRVFCDEHRRRYALAADAIRAAGVAGVIVDAACGTGYGFEYLAPPGAYVGLDGSLAAVAECRRRYPAGDFRAADLDGPEPFAPTRPAAIVSLETAEHLADPLAFLRACHAALTHDPDTLLVFSAPTSLTRDFDPYHRRDFTSERWREILRRAGFIIRSETPMPFTTTFAEFRGTVPVSWRQAARVAAFDVLHPRYLAARLWQWGVMRTFSWESRLWVCTTSV